MSVATYEPFPDEDIDLPDPNDTAWARTERPFLCHAPLVWPNVDDLVSRPKDPTPSCWTEYPTAEARLAHQKAEHAEWYAAVNAPRDPNPAPTRGLVEEPMSARPSGPPRASHPDWVMSEKQLKWITDLAAKKGVEVPEATSQKSFGQEIERLQAMPNKEADKPKPNRFAGPCSDCGVRVEAEAGMIRKDEETQKWLVGHIGGCPLPLENVEEAAPDTGGVPNGFYAVEAEAGHLSFYKVTLGRKPGVVFVDLLLGGGPNGSFVKESVPFKNRPTILAKIAEAGPEVAGMLFRTEKSRCMRCGRGLSNEVSRSQGFGSECVKLGLWG